MLHDDRATILAISSATGHAPRMIVRMSGPAAMAVAAGVAPGASFAPASAERTAVMAGGLMFSAWVYAFGAPRSYTGEDLVELHLPGNPLLAAIVVDELITRGARQAEPGEFTARAYFNGRMDLAQAEGVAATIAAQGEAELRAARQLFSGELSRRLRPVMDQLADALALVEVGIDFIDEDVRFLSSEDLANRIRMADDCLANILHNSARFERLSHEPAIMLVGRPNAGKSTLLNALAGMSRAVVSPIEGTTRDVLEARVMLRRGMVRIRDVAGLDDVSPPRGDAAHSSDAHAQIAEQMRAFALRAVAEADVVALVLDGMDTRAPVSLSRSPDVLLLTKADLLPAALPGHSSSRETISVSAHTGAGLEAARDRLDELAFGLDSSASATFSLALNTRHARLIEEAREALLNANISAPELAAADLRLALDALGQILGAVSPDDVLGRIFSTFCIGK